MKLSSEYIIPALKKTTQQIVTFEINRICKYFKIDTTLIRAKTRRNDILLPRWICMYRLRTIYHFSYERIGVALLRTPQTVMNACNKIDYQKKIYSDIKKHLRNLK